jgi:hypothetical protein
VLSQSRCLKATDINRPAITKAAAEPNECFALLFPPVGRRRLSRGVGGRGPEGIA